MPGESYIQLPDNSYIHLTGDEAPDQLNALRTKLSGMQTDPLTRQTNAAAQGAGIQNPGESGIQPNQYQSFLRNGRPMPPGAANIEQKGAQLDRLGAAQNRARRSPNPVTQAASVVYPAAAMGLTRFLTSMATGYGGSEAAGYGMQKMGYDQDTQNAARLGGGVVGGSLPFLPGAVSAMRSAVPSAAYTPEGELSPGANAALHPTSIPEYLFRKVFPQPTELPSEGTGAPLPGSGEFYEQKGAALMARDRAQGAIDRASARDASIDPVAQAVKARTASWIPTKIKPQPEPGSPGSGIVAPDAGPRFVGNEGRAATWTNDRVMELAGQGNRVAIQQAIRRGLQLPENARYVAGDPNFSSGVYNPRDVTTFTPEGTPIKQGGKKVIPLLPWLSKYQ